jgi:phosphoribosylanthranilate isomerase
MKDAHTEIKICGITRLEDALCAAASGADAVGFIFHEASPRYITPEKAKSIIAQLPAGIARVGVFVNREAEEVKRTVDMCGLDLIQLHGDETPDYCRLFPSERVIKAVSPRMAEELRALAVYEVRAFLVDARDGGRYGGTGKRADWALAARLEELHPLILAGGLDAENIEAALAAVSPRAVDINSGCELTPGIKDHRRMRQIIRMIRGTTPGTIHGTVQATILSRGAPGPKAIFDSFVKK